MPEDQLREGVFWTFTMPKWWLVNGKPLWSNLNKAMTRAQVEACASGTRARVQLRYAVRGRHRKPGRAH